MTRSLFIFLGTFVAGALIALVARAAMYQPHAGHESGAAETSAAVSTNARPAAAPADGKTSAVKMTAPAAAHAHDAPAAATAVADKTPVNAVCAICGMKVDPSLPTAEYQGKTIGFGCKMCAPKFKADPDRYGPLYLKGEVLKN
ncbi:hypothetical protein [Horticoccus sp. 23ND18S-11]|uniref:hypothetical protein n=1 Tax=Horticoccus sp. 23ND18S-11 TaxID=3391832 RepID=UPI0039C8CEE6